MGVTNGRDLLSDKYPTAIIIDSVNGAHFVAIKKPVGDYFFVVLNDDLYCFDTKGDIYTWRQPMAKKFQFYIYFTEHYRPINSHFKELELILEKNNLPRFSLSMFRLFKFLVKREKRKFEAHKIKDLIEEFSNLKKDDPDKYAKHKDLLTFLRGLDIDEISTPVKRVTDMMDESFRATDPKFIGAIKTSLQMLMTQNKEVNHKPIGAKKGWMKFMLVFMAIGLIGAILYTGYTDGWFDNLGLGGLGEGFGSIGEAFKLQGGGGASSSNDIVSQYPTPADAKAAIDAGKAKLSDFPPSMRELITKAEVGARPNP